MSLKRKLVIWYYRIYYFLHQTEKFERKLKRQNLVFMASCSKNVRDPSLVDWKDLDITGWSLEEITARMG